MTSFLVFEGRIFQGVFTVVLLRLMLNEAVFGRKLFRPRSRWIWSYGSNVRVGLYYLVKLLPFCRDAFPVHVKYRGHLVLVKYGAEYAKGANVLGVGTLGSREPYGQHRSIQYRSTVRPSLRGIDGVRSRLNSHKLSHAVLHHDTETH